MALAMMLGQSAQAAQGTKVDRKTTAKDTAAERVHPVRVGLGINPSGKVQVESSAFAPDAILYDQTTSASTNGISTQDFETAYNAYDDQAADDFVVAGSGWVVQTVLAPGVYFNGVGPVTTVHVTFYDNAGTLPGTVLCDYPALTTFTGGASGSLTITLSPSACILGPGTKWISVRANMNFGGGQGQWGWTQRTVLTGNPAVWQNPGGGFGTTCATYTPATVCGIGTDPDIAFQLQGTVAGCTVDADCQDGNLCNGSEVCNAGTCAAGTPVNCDDGLFCTVDACTPATGVCTHAPNPCSDNNGCTVDTCAEVGGCTHVAQAPIQFCNAGSIAIPSSGTSTPYPSNIAVAGLGTSASLCSVQLNGVTHTFPDDIDMMLVGPAGGTQNATIMSDVGGSIPATAVNLTLTDGAASLLPDAGPLVSGTFKPTNIGATDPFAAPAPTPTGVASLAAFTGNPNGTWSLYVVDDLGGDLGSVAGGWCVNIVVAGCTTNSDCSDGNLCNGVETCVANACVPGTSVNCDDSEVCTIDACVPGTGLCTHTADTCDDNDSCTTDSCVNGVGCQHANGCIQFCSQNGITINDSATPPTIATAYPDSISISGLGTNAVVQSVVLQGINHTFPDDIDMLLEGPVAGTNAIIMSDVGGGTDLVNVNLTLSDGAAASIPDAGPIVSGTFKPTNVNPGTGTEAWPAPAPVPGGGSVLSVFSGNPNGTWNLYVVDDEATDAGSMSAWCLNIRVICAIDADCNDGNVCNGAETCSNNSCVPGTPLNCSDPNPCTDDTCDPILGCQHSNNTEACDDNNQCTILDACAGGACAGTLIVCDDSNPCTLDTCLPATGCDFAPITAPPATSGVAAPNKTTFTWSPAAFATQYDVVRGSTSALPVGPGGGDEVCFDDLTGPSLTDAAVPASGSGFWYLSRGENTCGNGSYGTQSNGSPRTTTTCP